MDSANRHFQRISLARKRFILHMPRIPVSEAQAVAGALTDNQHLRMQDRGTLRIISPTGATFWTRGQKVQIAWTGQARGPYELRLVNQDSPAGQGLVMGTVSQGNGFRWTVPDDLAPGRYQVRLQARDNRTNSPIFQVHAQGLPDLALAAADIKKITTPDSEHPYQLRIRGVIENRGGPLNQGFKIRLQAVESGINFNPSVIGGAEIMVPRLLNTRTFAFDETFPVDPEPSYDIMIHIDPDNRVAESNEDNNLFEKKGYRGMELPDLALHCGQRGGGFSCWVSNLGARPSWAATMTFACTHVDEQGRTRHPRLIPYSLGVMAPGDRIRVDRDLPFAPNQSGDTCTAAVNKHASFSEENLANNTTTFALHPADQSNWGETEPLGAQIMVSNQTPTTWSLRRQQEEAMNDNDQLAPAPEQYPAHPRFRFVLNAKGGSVSPPARATLVVHDSRGGTGTWSWDIPPLFPGTAASSQRDRFVIEQVGNYPVGVTLNYTLNIRAENGTDSFSAASGTMQIGR